MITSDVIWFCKYLKDTDADSFRSHSKEDRGTAGALEYTDLNRKYHDSVSWNVEFPSKSNLDYYWKEGKKWHAKPKVIKINNKLI